MCSREAGREVYRENEDLILYQKKCLSRTAMIYDVNYVISTFRLLNFYRNECLSYSEIAMFLQANTSTLRAIYFTYSLLRY